jgi:hypothetical protein
LRNEHSKALTKSTLQSGEKGSSARSKKSSRPTRTPCTLGFELFAATPQSGLYQQTETPASPLRNEHSKALTKSTLQSVEKGSSARSKKSSRPTRTPCTLGFELFAATPQSGLYQQTEVPASVLRDGHRKPN